MGRSEEESLLVRHADELGMKAVHVLACQQEGDDSRDTND